MEIPFFHNRGATPPFRILLTTVYFPWNEPQLTLRYQGAYHQYFSLVWVKVLWCFYEDSDRFLTIPPILLTHTYTHTGISGKSQFLFALVFTTRYLDIFTNFVSPYNTVMKVVFLVTTYGTLYLIFFKFKATYDSNHDTFRAEFLVIPAAGLAVLVNHEFSVMEVSGSGRG